MKYYFIIIISLILFSCTSEEIGFIENVDLSSQASNVTAVEVDVEELELNSAALDLLKVYNDIIINIIRSDIEMQFPDYYGGMFVNDKVNFLSILVTENPDYYKKYCRT